MAALAAAAASPLVDAVDSLPCRRTKKEVTLGVVVAAAVVVAPAATAGPRVIMSDVVSPGAVVDVTLNSRISLPPPPPPSVGGGCIICATASA